MKLLGKPSVHHCVFQGIFWWKLLKCSELSRVNSRGTTCNHMKSVFTKRFANSLASQVTFGYKWFCSNLSLQIEVLTLNFQASWMVIAYCSNYLRLVVLVQQDLSRSVRPSPSDGLIRSSDSERSNSSIVVVKDSRPCEAVNVSLVAQLFCCKYFSRRTVACRVENLGSLLRLWQCVHMENTVR